MQIGFELKYQKHNSIAFYALSINSKATLFFIQISSSRISIAFFSHAAKLISKTELRDQFE